MRPWRHTDNLILNRGYVIRTFRRFPLVKPGKRMLNDTIHRLAQSVPIMTREAGYYPVLCNYIVQERCSTAPQPLQATRVRWRNQLTFYVEHSSWAQNGQHCKFP